MTARASTGFAPFPPWKWEIPARLNTGVAWTDAHLGTPAADHGAYALFDHPDTGMTPEVREELFFETSLELLSLGRVLRHMKNVPLQGFPHAHILSLMSQIPVRDGMKIAYEKWKSNKDSLREKRSIVS